MLLPTLGRPAIERMTRPVSPLHRPPEEPFMTPTPPASTAALWARFRFSVVGALLSSPPPRGDLKAAIRSLAARTWTRPTTGRDVHFSAVTIERWYYTARRAH